MAYITIVVVSSFTIGQSALGFDDAPKDRETTRANTIGMDTLSHFAERID
jgi:hypothetical protein